MATIGDLIGLLERQAHALNGRQPEDTPDGHAAAWTILARHTRRAISNLPLGGRRPTVDAGVATVLDPMINFRWKPLGPEVTPAPALAGISLTVGAIADVLAATARLDPRPALVGTEATRLQAGLLAPLHVTARWSRAVLEDQHLSLSRQALVRALRDLATVTEPYALIPPAQRASLLEDLRLRTPSAPALEGAVVAWANTVKPVLEDRYQVSGWAMQAVAGNLALLSHVARTTIVQAAARGALPPVLAEEASVALGESVRAWRAAATWPPTLRLGGQSGELREAVRGLNDACTTEHVPKLAEVRHILGVAADVGALHAQVMGRLVTRHELWVDADSLGPAAGHVSGWIREPWWSAEGVALLESAGSGRTSLVQSAALVDKARTLGQLTASRWPRDAGQSPKTYAIERGLHRGGRCGEYGLGL